MKIILILCLVVQFGFEIKNFCFRVAYIASKYFGLKSIPFFLAKSPTSGGSGFLGHWKPSRRTGTIFFFSAMAQAISRRTQSSFELQSGS
jgi:hypothetical protein